MCSRVSKALNGSLNFIFFLAFALCSLLRVSGWTEVVDRIVAIVNDEVITLTDINIVKTFGLYEDLEEGSDEDVQSLVLDRLISQKLIIRLTSERMVVEEEELESALGEIIQSMEPGETERALIRFGMDWDDLKRYLREKLLYQKIIAQRFDRGVIVRLEEIENYYEQIYIPNQRAKGLEPQPLIEMLDQIEREIKQTKVRTQVQEWIKNVRREADIQIKIP
jgi:peptidyl-prolyl cis-trans isomerase SurA